MLKLTTLILGTLISYSAMASTHGGGVLMKNAMMRAGNGTGTMDALFSAGGGGPITNKEIIFHIGQKDGLVSFANGQLIKNKWQVEKLELPTQEILKDEEVVQALELSKAIQN